MTILIDIGNTAIKWQLRESEQTADTGRGDVSQLMLWLESLGNPTWMFFILFMVLWNAPYQYNPFGIAQNVMAAYLGLFGFVMG